MSCQTCEFFHDQIESMMFAINIILQPKSKCELLKLAELPSHILMVMNGRLLDLHCIKAPFIINMFDLMSIKIVSYVHNADRYVLCIKS